MSDTPRTDAAINQQHHRYNAVKKDGWSFARTLERENAAMRDQLYRICKEGFGNQDTIGQEPADDYVLRQLAAMREQIEHLGKANSMLHLDLVDAHAETAKETRRADKAEVENAAMREAIRVSLIRAYTAGYLHGHEGTVEGGFIPVHRSDETEFHAESIHQMLCDGSLPELQTFLKP